MLDFVHIGVNDSLTLFLLGIDASGVAALLAVVHALVSSDLKVVGHGLISAELNAVFAWAALFNELAELLGVTVEQTAMLHLDEGLGIDFVSVCLIWWSTTAVTHLQKVSKIIIIKF